MTRCTVLRHLPLVQTSYNEVQVPDVDDEGVPSRRHGRPLARLEQDLEPARVEGAHVVVILAEYGIARVVRVGAVAHRRRRLLSRREGRVVGESQTTFR